MVIFEQLVELVSVAVGNKRSRDIECIIRCQALYILAGREHRRDSNTSNEIRLSDLHGSEHGDSTVDLTSQNSADLENLENNKQYRDSLESLPSMDERPGETSPQAPV
jgi:hypothetical protein